MKFYFCETCGRRITEHEIASGQGRDKKLKGVYCSGCAQGVTTMESLPMTEKEARKMLDHEAPRPSTDVGSRAPRRRTTATRLPAGHGGASPRSRSTRTAALSGDTGARHTTTVVIAAALAVATLGGLVVFLGREDAPSASPRIARKAVPDRDGPVPVTKKENKKAESTPRNASGDEVSHGTSKHVTGESPSPSSEPPSPLAKKTDRAVASVDGPPPSSDQAPSPDVGKKSVPAPETPPAKPEPSRTDELASAKAKLVPYLKAFEAAVSSGDLSGVSGVVGRAKADPALKPVAKEVESLGRVADALARSSAQRKRAREALADGKKHTFQTDKYSVTGVVRKVEGAALTVWVQGRIGKRAIEYAKQVKLADLTPACRGRLLPEPRPETSDEWMAEAFQKIAAKDAKQAEQALTKAGAHPLSPYCGNRLIELRASERESGARRLWEEELKPLLGVKEFSKPKAKAGQKLLAEFQTKYAQTKYAVSLAGQAGALGERLQFALGPPRQLTLDLGDGVTMAFALVPAGTFMMGDPPGTKEVKDAWPQHKVTLTKAFYLGKHEVTQTQYRHLMGTNPSKVKGPELPVTIVSWDACLAFCEKVNARTGRKTRLPTEAEWEYACRAGSTTRFCYGDSEDGFGDFAWYRENSGGRPHPVGQKKPNAYGLYDMHGNAAEWCSDWREDYAAEDVTDPKGPATGISRIFRGGAKGMIPGYCRSAARAHRAPSRAWSVIGFRVALDP